MKIKDSDRQVRNYGDIYSIKDFMLNSIAPQYFDMDEVNQFNVGLLGYVTELQSVSVEDTFNTMNTLIHEMFATRATLPSTLYTKASMLDVDGYITAKPSVVEGTIFIRSEDIIKYGYENRTEDEYVFVLDSDTVVDIDGVPYMFDYNINIQIREVRGAWVYTSRFDMSHNNVLSDVRHPYLKTFEMNISSENYVGINVPLRQVEKLRINEVMISNDNINFPVIEIEHDDMLAGMNVFYKAPTSDKFIQLDGRLYGGTPLRTPFYYYTLRDERRVEISFTSMDRYFQPEYNSEVVVELYSTTGSKGNFKEYNGTNTAVIGKSEVYDYNNSTIVMFGVVRGSSKYGTDRLGLEELRSAIVEKKATSGAYNTEDDLQLYLHNYSRIDNTFVLFVKKRDDIIRLFSGFILMKNSLGDYFHTNTLDVRIKNTQFDTTSDVSKLSTLKAGKLIGYDGSSLKTAKLLNKDDVDLGTEDRNKFYYTNPFLITYGQSPTVISYFMNSVNDVLPLDFVHAEDQSPYQFMANNISVYRNSLIGEDSYKITVNFKPATGKVTVDQNTGELDIGDDTIKVVLSIKDGTGSTSVAYEMDMVSFNQEDQLFTFETEIFTDDEISGSDRFIVKDPFVMSMKNINSEYPIPMDNVEVHVNILTKSDEFVKENMFWDMEGISGYSVSNIYAASTDKVSFIKPLGMIQSQAKYEPGTDGEYIINVAQVPLLAHNVIEQKEEIDLFVKELHYMHDYLQGIIDMVTTNYSIDLKFYNTYGRSRNFTVGEKKELLNRTNVSTHLQIFPTIGANVDELFRDVRLYVKNYIENINKNKDANINIKGYNSVYISNLIQELENEFPELKYMKFVAINEYDSSVQVIENETTDTVELTSDERREYVPEYLTIRLEDIRIDLLSR